MKIEPTNLLKCSHCKTHVGSLNGDWLCRECEHVNIPLTDHHNGVRHWE